MSLGLRENISAESMEELDIDTFVKHAQNGSSEAWEFLSDYARRKMYSTALSLCGEHIEDAQDLLQEVLLKIFLNIHRYAVGTKFDAWIFTILRNTFNDRYRKKQRQPTETSFEDLPEIHDDEILDLAVTAIGREDLERVSIILPTLITERQQLIMHLRFIEGLSYVEIAKKLNTGEGAICSAVYRSRRKLEMAIFGSSKRNAH